MSLTLPGGSDRLSREREEAHARYHDALAALDRLVNDTERAIAAGPPSPAELLQRAVTFQSLLIQFFQQITPYVDTKLRVIEQAAADATMTATSAQRAAMAAKRAADADAGDAGVGRTFRSADNAPDEGVAGTFTSADPVARTFRSATDAATYLGFEDLFRGSEDAIRQRQADYVPLFAGATDVLDVGCGRGEFLELLRDAGVSARGIDINDEMVAACRAKGLQGERADAVGYLRGLPGESLGGLFAAQVVEHLEPDELLGYIRQAGRVLRPGARLVLETINPTCWVAFFESYIRDLTHARPLHPDTLKFLVVANGFTNVEVRFRTPIPESDRLQKVAASTATNTPETLRAVIDAFNLNMERLNDRLFTHLDYAIIAARG
jgi:SAM-dependent methyltransferase